MTRREWVRSSALLGGALLAPMINRGRCRLWADSPQRYSTRAIGLVERSLVIDMLGLVTLDWKQQTGWLYEPETFAGKDLRKVQSSAISVFHPAVHFPSGDPAEMARRFFAAWNHFLDRRPDHFLRVAAADDLAKAKAQGRVGVVLGLQNSDHVQVLDDVDRFYALGQRVSQLTYNARNRVGGGCMERPDPGLTEYGAALIRRMNEVGMGIDVSHCGPRTTLDAFEASRRPVLITHANCAALVPDHPRCKSDEVLRRLARNGSVIGITAISSFVRRGQPVTLSHLVDHFVHVARLVGVDHVGVGSDTDLGGHERSRSIVALNQPQRIFDLTEALIRRGFSDSSIELILGGNFARVLAEIWSRPVDSPSPTVF